MRHSSRPRADLSRFWVITPISNPKRFSRRYELFLKFQEMVEAAGVNFCPIEQAFGLRPFVVTDASNPRHIQVRSVDELWHKENMINKAVAHVVEKFDAREVAWIDGDCRPAMPSRMWFEETWHALQHYKWVQMWQWMIDLNLAHNPIGEPQPSFMYNYIKHGSPGPEEFARLSAEHAAKYGVGSEYYPGAEARYPGAEYGVSKQTLFGRPGLAWAANVDDFEAVGGLIDFSIVGAGDWYAAHGLVGSMDVTAGEHYSPAYAKRLKQWQKRALDAIRKDVGYVEGTLLHDFHGRKQLRGYNTRGRILQELAFDPDTDIQRDRYGLWQLVNVDERQWQLRDRLRAYFSSRREDSTTGGEEE